MRATIVFLPPCDDTSPRGWWATEIVFGPGRDGRDGRDLQIINKTLVMAAGGWDQTGRYYEYPVTDPDITDPCQVNVYPDNDTRDIALAAVLLKPDYADGRMTVLAVNRPAGNINVTYSIVK